MSFENFVKKLTARPSLLLLVGKPASGKSVLIRYLMYIYTKLNYFKYGIVYTPTKLSRDHDYIDEKYIIEDYSEEHLKNYTDRIKTQIKKTGKKHDSFIIFDDNFGNLNFYSPFFSNLLAIHRHLGITIIISSQYLNGFGSSTQLRECCQFAFIFRTAYKRSIKALFELCGHFFDHIDDFKHTLQDMTNEEHTCMLYINSQSTEEESYFPLKASIAPKFLMKY